MTLPIIVYVFATEATQPAIIFLVWTLIAGLSDNILKPLMLGRGLEVPMPVILIGVIGGMIADGLLGLFVGPVVLAVGYVLLIEWMRQRRAQSGAADRRSDGVKCDFCCRHALGSEASWHRCSGCQTRVASMSADPEVTNKIAVEELTPAKPAPAETDSANPLRRAALIVVAVTILLFALSIVMERFTPSSSQAVVQAYVIRMAPEVAGRVIGVDVADNARVDAGQVLFRIDPAHCRRRRRL